MSPTPGHTTCERASPAASARAGKYPPDFAGDPFLMCYCAPLGISNFRSEIYFVLMLIRLAKRLSAQLGLCQTMAEFLRQDCDMRFLSDGNMRARHLMHFQTALGQLLPAKPIVFKIGFGVLRPEQRNLAGIDLTPGDIIFLSIQNC